jgi:hypothetical protein
MAWIQHEASDNLNDAGVADLQLPDHALDVIRAVRNAKLTYLPEEALSNLARAALAMDMDGVPGDFIEAGVAYGGSAIVMGKLKQPARALRLYDVYSMIPPPSERDGEEAHRRYEVIKSGKSRGIGGDRYYGYADNLVEFVRGNLVRFALAPEPNNVQLVRGKFEDTLLPPNEIALAHIDCDWHDSVTVCIERIVPRLSQGGIIIFDDYGTYGGCQRAVDRLVDWNTDLEVVFGGSARGLRRRRMKQ